MKVIIADGKEKLNIGRQTDNERTTVVFPLADLLEEFPGGAASLKIRRPHENEFYVSETTSMDGTNLLWLVQDYDVAIEGDGEVQLYYTVDDVAAPSRIFKTHSDRSLTDQAAALPGWSSWKDELIAAGNEILDAIYAYDSPLTKKMEITLEEEAAISYMSPVGGDPLAENEMHFAIKCPTGMEIPAGSAYVYNGYTSLGEAFHVARAASDTGIYWFAKFWKEGGVWNSKMSRTFSSGALVQVWQYFYSNFVSERYARSSIEFPSINKITLPVLPAGTQIVIYAR